ncbi:MAG: ATPase, T2SS/T4P/T4SS family [Thermodesulfobacteriota bacterium]|nr:ATPase, T2SS/T4P/T4SS family [Thermodesulfobacteriota bacterium]
MEQRYLSLAEMVYAIEERQPSDVFLKVDKPPLFKIKGKIVTSGLPKLNEKNIFLLLQEIDKEAPYLLNEKKDLDLSYRIKNPEGMFESLRVSALYQQQGKPVLVLRTVSKGLPTLESLSLSPKVRKLIVRMLEYQNGLIIIAGGTGSGKSSLLSGMLEYLIHNSYSPRHILIIEDPIERMQEDVLDYETGSVKAVITHREIGRDTIGFKDALKGALRQSPNVIIIGELREKETIELTLQAGQTGHLVISTLHSLDTYQAINKVINFFDNNQQESIRYQLADCLIGIISQRLLKRAYTIAEQIALIEIMFCTDTIKELIRKNETRDKFIEEIKKGEETQSFDQHREELIKYDFI